MSLRPLLLLVIGLLVLYAAWQLFRALAARQEAARAARRSGAASLVDEAVGGDEDDEDDGEEDVGGYDYAPLPRPLAPDPASAAPAPAQVRDEEREAERFRLNLELQQMRQDIARLQAQHLVQNGEIGELRESLRALREQFEANLAGQGVSPEYNEALVLARRGLAAEAIAERCGISMAEAELVCSMTRRPPDEGDLSA